MSEIHTFNHHAMATHFQVRIANEEKLYAEQTAQTAFALTDQLEAKLSRFRVHSEISQIARLAVGEKLRLTEPVFACLKLAQQMEFATRGAFSVTAAALKTQPTKPLWALVDKELSIRCDSGRLAFDLGAVGKGFALDRMADVLREWSCPAFLLVAGGSSILAGDAPTDSAGWSCGLGEDDSARRHWLKNISMSGSGLAVKGEHIFDPRTGQPCSRRNRAWALASSAAESDALSTACMVMDESAIEEIVQRNDDWLVFLNDQEDWRHLGNRPVPPLA
jgi:thiamine biosynthesis lipoprotein